MSLEKFLLCYSIQFCIWRSLYWKLYKVKFQSEYTLEETLYYCRNVVRPILQIPKFKVNLKGISQGWHFLFHHLQNLPVS